LIYLLLDLYEINEINNRTNSNDRMTIEEVHTIKAKPKAIILQIPDKPSTSKKKLISKVNNKFYEDKDKAQ
jgi:hypothetical protein